MVPIEYFSEIDQGVVAGVDGEQAAASVPSLTAGQAVGSSYLVFIDEYFAVVRDRNRLLDRLAQQLDRLGENDRMAIVRYDGRNLDMLTTWTRSRDELAAVIARERQNKAFGLQRLAEQRQEEAALRGLVPAGRLASDPLGGQLSLDERYYVERLTGQVERVVTAAASTLRSFAAPPGRKVMILLSGGWPYDPAEYVLNDNTRPITEVDLVRGRDLLDPLTDTANLLGYTIYPVDVPGLQTIGGAGADTGFENLVADSFVRESNLHGSLLFIAEQTGGVALLNSRREDVLQGVVEDLGSYYWLGFAPERKGDDQRHRVRVTVKRPGLKVRSRQGYLDFSRQREVTLAVESALYFGAPPSPHPLLVQLGKAERSGLRTMKVPVSLRIPADAVTFLPGPDGLSAQLELRIAVLDSAGATADTPVIPLSLTVAEPPMEGAQLSYQTTIKLRRRQQDLVVAIYDIASGTILSSALEVAPK